MQRQVIKQMRSKFSIYDIDRDREIIFIEDDDGPVSVTNDAENVLRSVRNATGDSYRVVYKDSTGEWWEIVENRTTWMGTGIGFEPWNGLAWDILNTEEPQ